MACDVAQRVNDYKFTLDNTCRICLFHFHPVRNVFDTYVASGEPVYQVLNFVFGLDIALEDPLPPNICQPCLWKMTEFYALKTNALSAKSLLLDIVQKLRNITAENGLVVNVTEGSSTCEGVDTDRATVEEEAEEFEVDYSDIQLQEQNLANHVGAEDRDVEKENVNELGISIKEEIEIEEYQIPAEFQDREDCLEACGSGEEMHCFQENRRFNDKLELAEVGHASEADSYFLEENLNVQKELVSLKISEDISTSNILECLKESKESALYLNREEALSIVRTAGNLMKKDTEELICYVKDNRIIEKESADVVKTGSSKNVAECNVLGKKSPSAQGRKSYKCNICQKGFRLKGNMAQHKMIHSVDKPYACSICDKRFKYKNVRKQHELTHLRDEQNKRKNDEEILKKPYPCTVCGKRFALKRTLRTHSNIHTTKYSCAICRKSFSCREYLKSHSMTHSNEKPFSCKLCHKSFNWKYYLRVHMATHSSKRPFSCDVCEKEFKTKAEKARHELLHLIKL